MTALNKQSLREAAKNATGSHERLSVMPADDIFDISLHEGTQLDADITALNEFNESANPSTVLALLDELEAAENELSECKNLLEKIKSTSCHVDTSKGAFIPNSLDAWGRPVPQYLPYDFSGNPGASATQYCNGWNDAGGYWLNHTKYLQECIRAAGIGVKGE